MPSSSPSHPLPAINSAQTSGRALRIWMGVLKVQESIGTIPETLRNLLEPLGLKSSPSPPHRLLIYIL
ncbi:hypothetical protein PAXRUDRAFT_19002 [Paxillus rubicundulus Ve08.2h10]|uniref:Uncharacterized protein n=1 Tax=Paxillus rubicundulus Ve08.2h10 TaxID=930991 RepID=A0A0D0D5X2_9AGAM|nr:hypothetical protein PAXRUDRAFT_19002 [Paxillus rubicundulus Ve08.2h10]